MSKMKTQASPSARHLPRARALAVASPVLISMLVLIGAGLLSSPARASNPAVWSLVWSDEFDRPNGSAVDPSKWTFDIGGNGWGNHELESYTNRLDNSEVQNGELVIKALRETYTGSDNITRNYTSARILTRTKFAQTYGRFEARLKVPYGQGIWPAFWMLGDNIGTAGWPNCGEIDIMENIGREPLDRSRTPMGQSYPVAVDNRVIFVACPAKVLRRFPHVCSRVGAERPAVLC